MTIEYWEVVVRLMLAVVLGGLIGFERESHHRPAGFRTHILVCSGSALIMMVSAYGFTGQIGQGFEADPGRIAAGVVTGIGFLGAGTIIQQRGSVSGLTTAASIWVVSGVGLAAGIGFYLGAVVTTLLVLGSLLMLRRTEKIIFNRRKMKNLQVRAIDQPGLLGRIGTTLGEYGIQIRRNEVGDPEQQEDGGEAMIDLVFMVETPPDLDLDEIFNHLARLKGVVSVGWQNEQVRKVSRHWISPESD